FHRVLEDHVSACFAAIVENDKIDEALRQFPHKVVGLTPFRLVFSQLLHHVLENKKFMHFEGKIQFIFDNQQESKEVHEDWEKLFSKHPVIQTEIASEPLFLRDNDVMPLQAADHYAWWTRRREVERITGIERLEPPWKGTKPIPNLRITF